jgi:hypothetical protein
VSSGQAAQPRRAGIQQQYLHRRNWIPDNLRFTAVSGMTALRGSLFQQASQDKDGGRPPSSVIAEGAEGACPRSIPWLGRLARNPHGAHLPRMDDFCNVTEWMPGSLRLPA